MLVVNHRVYDVTDAEWKEKDAQVLECHPVELLRAGLFIRSLVGEYDTRENAQELSVVVDGDVDHLVNLPYLDSKADEAADLNDGVGLVVEHVQQHDQRLKNVKEHGPHTEPLHRFSFVPELNV